MLFSSPVLVSWIATASSLWTCQLLLSLNKDDDVDDDDIDRCVRRTKVLDKV